MKKIKFTILALVCLTSIGCGIDNKNSQIQPSSQNIIISSNFFNPPKILNKIKMGMSKSDVLKQLGQPKEIQVNGNSTSWFYTYEFPDKKGQEKWQILEVEFKSKKVISVFWLPQG